jgi:hypothetical protein
MAWSDPHKAAVPQTCIADLLGPKARAMGCRCPCPKCSPPKPDFKKIAGNDLLNS